MTLQEKVLNLKLQGATAMRHALWWEKQIRDHGEAKATAFYQHLGLNHIERKGFEFEGLTLSREPNEHEKIAVKGIHQSQETAKERIGKVLLSLRDELIESGLKAIGKLEPADYHTLTLTVPKESESDLRDELDKTFLQGRRLVAAELGTKADLIDGIEDEEIDTLTRLTGSRVANDVQSRIAAAAARFRQAGLTGNELTQAIGGEVNSGSSAYIDRAAIGVGNRSLALGRSAEAENRSDEWGRVEYSALLDSNVCEPCAGEDGKTAESEDDLQPAPNPECLGSDFCRCFLVYVQV